MATKTWVGGATGATTDFSNDANWLPISIRTGSYQWTASGSGTNEYYLEANGGSDPSLVEPANVAEAGTNLTAGTAGSLAASQWDYADNDTLGYSTVYVRLADGADPDSKRLDYVTYTDTPKASDSVRIPATSSYAIDEGVDALAAISLTDFHVEAGYTKNIASATDYMQITATGDVSFAGTGTIYVDLQASNVTVEVLATKSVSDGLRGLYLRGSNLAQLNCHGGQTGLAVGGGETSTVATVRVTSNSASLWIGNGVTISTSYYQSGGFDCRLLCACTTVTVFGGTLKTDEDGAVTTLNVHGGTVTSNSTGTITTVNLYGGTLDLLQSGLSRTITTLNVLMQSDAKLLADKNVLTISTLALPTDRPYEASFSAA